MLEFFGRRDKFMGFKEVIPEQEKFGSEFKERSTKAISEALEVGVKYRNREISYTQMMQQVKEIFKKSDESSSDGHSFCVQLLINEFKIDLLPAPATYTVPEYEQDSTSGPLMRHEIEHALSTPQGMDYLKQMQNLTKSIHESSQYIAIPKIGSRSEPNPRYELELIHSLNQIAELTREGNVSRYLLISGKTRNGSFVDLHSVIILGTSPDGKDILVVEKHGLGVSAEISTLKKVVEDCSSRYSHLTDVVINIFNGNIADIS